MNFYQSLTLVTLLIQSLIASSQTNPDSLIHIEVLGNDTSPWINSDIGKKNQVFYNPTSTSNNTLLLHLVGTIDNPNGTTYYPIEATENGFHVINLMYRNWTSAQSACAQSVDLDCYLNFRKEIIEGVDYSSEINVNNANSIENRLLKLLEHLHAIYPNHQWDQYYSGSTINWGKLMVSGHSQGGGHAAVIGISKPVKRVIMFASPNDYIDTLNMIADWTALSHVVADSNYYGFNAYHDDVVEFWQQSLAWNALGMSTFGDTVNVDITTSPYNQSRQLYTKDIVPNGGLEELTHNVMIRDNQTPMDQTSTPVYIPVWKYLLGIEDAGAGVSNSVVENILVFPNPTSSYITLKSNNRFIDQFNLYDLQGRLILRQVNNSNEVTLDLTTFETGNYLIKVLDSKQKETIVKVTKD